MNENEIELARNIGEFFLAECGNDYRETERRLRSMEIADLRILSSKKVMIILRRPGLLIGPKGQTIEALQKYLGKQVQIIEETRANLYDHLVPRDYSDYG